MKKDLIDEVVLQNEEFLLTPHTKRAYRDSLFRAIYSGNDERSKRWVLSLYNALTGKNHTDTSELEITTIEDKTKQPDNSTMRLLPGLLYETNLLHA